MQISVGIITVSDRASRGEYNDLGGPALKEAALKNNWSVLCEAIVPDEIAQIQETIRSFAAQGCGLILTTGGTGLAARDITPEAIRGLMRVELPGFGEVMRAQSMKITPNAILSRNLAAVEQSLVVALPANRAVRSNVWVRRCDPARCGARSTHADFVRKAFFESKLTGLRISMEILP
jgi:molybdopterin adenylyltransferase